MGMLDRYRKPGGFIQLLKIIETCGIQKRAKLLDSINTEDAAWEEALKEKIITVDRILSWPPQVLNEVFANQKDQTLAFAMDKIPSQIWNLSTNSFSHQRKRNISNIKTEKKSTDALVSSAFIEIIEGAREMYCIGDLHFKEFAVSLCVPDGIEELLGKNEGPDLSGFDKLDEMKEEKKIISKSKLDSTVQSHISNLKDRATVLRKENNALKQEVVELEQKLDKVRKLLG